MKQTDSANQIKILMKRHIITDDSLISILRSIEFAGSVLVHFYEAKQYIESRLSLVNEINQTLE